MAKSWSSSSTPAARSSAPQARRGLSRSTGIMPSAAARGGSSSCRGTRPCRRSQPAPHSHHQRDVIEERQVVGSDDRGAGGRHTVITLDVKPEQPADDRPGNPQESCAWPGAPCAVRSRLAAVPPRLGVIIVGHGTPPSGSCGGMPRRRCAPAVDSRVVDRVPGGVQVSEAGRSHVIGGSLTGAPRRSTPGSPVGTRCPSIQHVRDHRINAGPADCSPRATPKSRPAYRRQRRTG